MPEQATKYKICKSCKGSFPPTEQYFRRNNGKYITSPCIECHNKKNRDFWARKKEHDPEGFLEYNRKRGLKRNYSMSIQEYQRMFEDQDGLCLICNNPPGKKALSVDHNHISGEIRGLLCQTCNTALGMLKEDPKIILRMLDYLTHFNEGRV